MMGQFDFGDPFDLRGRRQRIAKVKRFATIRPWYHIPTTASFSAVTDIVGNPDALAKVLNQWAEQQGKTLPPSVEPEWVDAAVRLSGGSAEQLAAAVPVLDALMLPSDDGYGGQARWFASVLAFLPLT
jgi:hypothetical protein